MLNVALIGGGSHSRENHLPALARYAALHPEAIMLAAFCDRNPAVAEAIGRQYGFARTYTDVARMLADEALDACIAITPIDATLAVTRTVLAAGVPLLLEKPPGATVAEAKEIAALGGRAMVSVNRRFDPALRAADAARAGRPIQIVRASMLRHARTEPDFFTGTAIHAVDAVRFLAGDVASFRAEVRSVDGVRWYRAALEFTSGAKGSLDVLPTCGAVAETYELLGDGYRILATAGGIDSGEVHVWEAGQLVRSEAIAQQEPTYVKNGAYGETVAFLDALRDGRPLWPTPADILPSVELCHAIESA